ncbi:MAG: DNRLRE domain-containing protein, partial [Actinomycetota bacterium]|nr:DNRLRE domain-containing protein [Actinomycetota bacterium]
MIHRSIYRRLQSAVVAVTLGIVGSVFAPIVTSAVLTPAFAQTCPDPTLTPHDPRAAWVEGTRAADDGATRDFYNRAAMLEWDNFMGDWRDSTGTPQGDAAYATSTLPDDNIPGPHTWNVTSLVAEWIAGTPNQGFLLRQTGGSGPFNFYSKEHPVVTERPMLTIATSSGSFNLYPEADTHLDASTYQGFGDATTLRIGGNPTLLRFDLSAIPIDAVVTSATLQLFSFEEYGTSSLEVGVFQIFHDPGTLPPAANGLAYSFTDDSGIATHPDVLEFTEFTDAGWADVYDGGTDSPTLEVVSSAPGFEQIDGNALKVTVPAGINTGMGVGFKFGDQTGSEPTEIYFRYYVRIDQSWDPTYGGKFPGISGTYGVAGWGGRPSDGTNGWSARGGYHPTIPENNPLGDTVPVGHYVYHADQATIYGDNVLWQDGYLGFLEKDRWYSVEQHLVLNTPGVNDGILEAWVDGRLAYRGTDWRWRDTDSLKIEQIWLNVYHGGIDVPDQDISLYIDNVVIASSYIGPMTGAPCAPTSGTFIDDDDSVFEADIERLAAAGITKGCNPPINDRYCPDDGVTRDQMAAFLVRALGLTDSGTTDFVDDDGSIFEADIERLATAGITKGCNPPINDRYCPGSSVTRDQMAAFLVRALGLIDSGTTDFVDDDGSIFEADIERLATAGITKGCNPP